jgi:hypothetical protein
MAAGRSKSLPDLSLRHYAESAWCTDSQRWLVLVFGMYGVPILGILILRYLAWLANPVRGYSILVAYAWIFLISAILSTLGLAVLVELIRGYWTNFLGRVAGGRPVVNRPRPHLRLYQPLSGSAGRSKPSGYRAPRRHATSAGCLCSPLYAYRDSVYPAVRAYVPTFFGWIME